MSKGLQVKEGNKIELIVPHRDKNLTFIYPAIGPNTYTEVSKQISRSELKRPTMSETTSLIHAAWQNPDNKYSEEILRTLKENWFWTFTGILYVPHKGAYIQDNPLPCVQDNLMNESDIIKKLESNDESVRFIPFSWYNGEQIDGLNNPLKLTENPFVIGLVGKEGAEKLEEIAKKYKYRPYLNSYRYSSYGWGGPKEQRISSLNSNHGGSGLTINCNYINYSYMDEDKFSFKRGFAFGVDRK